MKSQNKVIILLLFSVVIGIGMPATFSIGKGQHQFLQINPDQPDKYCLRCHQNEAISSEMAQSSTGVYTQMKIHSTLTCVGCHKLTNGYGTGRAGDKVEHAARLPSCLECHDGQFNVLVFSVVDELNSQKEAHRNFKFVGDNDLQCIACHTNVQVSGSISYTLSGGKTYNGFTVGK